MAKLRVAVVASHPIQHFCPLYRALSNDGRLDVRVFFGSDAGSATYFDPAFNREISWGKDITAGFAHEYLLSSGGTVRHDVGRSGSRHIYGRLNAYQPDVIQTYGYRSVLSLQALLWARAHRRSAVMVADSELLSRRTFRTRAIKRLTLPLMLRIPSGFLSIGDRNEDYYSHYKVPPERVRRSPIAIDSPLLDSTMATRDAIRPEVRQSWGASQDDVVLLAVGKSIPRKGHDRLIRAVACMSESSRRRAVVVLAGGGPETTRLADLAKQLGVRVHSAGFLAVPSLAAAYVCADVLVHPSASDPHPLAVAEAVYCGLPIVVSDRVGSWGPSDDARPENGIRYPFGDDTSLADALNSLVESGTLRARLGTASRKIGAQRALPNSVDSYVQAIEALHFQPPRAFTMDERHV